MRRPIDLPSCWAAIKPHNRVGRSRRLRRFSTPTGHSATGGAGNDACRRGPAALTALADSQGLLLKSIGDLLNHPHPPVKLLVMLKDFAKRLMEHPDSPLPREVASLLYWSAIASGLSRGKVRLTSLDSEKLLAGLRWAASQSWVERPIIELIRSAEASVLERGGG